MELAGTRNAILNTEARTVEAEVLSRRCVIMRLVDFSYEEYQKALRQSAGAVVIILPKNMSAVPQDIVQVIMWFNSISRYTIHCQCITPQYTLSTLFLIEAYIYIYQKYWCVYYFNSDLWNFSGNMIIKTIFFWLSCAAVHGIGARDAGYWDHRPHLLCHGGRWAALHIHSNPDLFLLTGVSISSWR